jgi:thiamine-monophosphate kinase
VPGEFELIRRFFERADRVTRLRLGIGDDCALLDAPAGETLAVSTDMLVEGRHFFPGTDPEAIGHKALAVNLSDLAAMGARPIAFTLALALPDADERWLEPFARGLFALADAHGCELAGGDTTRGPLNLCITVFGAVPPAGALRRDGAHAGDDLWVSGTLGAAALAVERRRRGESPPPGAAERLDRPQPRVALGLALRGLAGAAIDLSDGLAGDLAHVLARSATARGASLGATLEAGALPFAPELHGLPMEERIALATGGGDDYELAFAAPPERRGRSRRPVPRSGLH